jgi:transcription-repair coupling factor (superfamily II helicase)
VDRFGPTPHEVETLLTLVAMRPAAMRLRTPRVTWKNERLFVTLPDAGEDAWFHAHRFQPFLAALAGSGRRYVLKDSAAGRLRAIVQDVRSLADGAAVLEALADATEAVVEDV